MVHVYSESDVLNRLRDEFPLWSYKDNTIVREVRTDDWRTTLLITMMIGYLAERAFHHPDLQISYDRIIIRLQTHDAGGITDKDFELARLIDDALTPHDPSSSSFSGPPYPFILKDDRGE